MLILKREGKWVIENEPHHEFLWGFSSKEKAREFISENFVKKNNPFSKTPKYRLVKRKIR